MSDQNICTRCKFQWGERNGFVSRLFPNEYPDFAHCLDTSCPHKKEEDSDDEE